MAARKPFLVRLDPKLHDELRRWADDELRSLNAQIEYLLRRAVEQHRKSLPAEGGGAQDQAGGGGEDEA